MRHKGMLFNGDFSSHDLIIHWQPSSSATGDVRPSFCAWFSLVSIEPPFLFHKKHQQGSYCPAICDNAGCCSNWRNQQSLLAAGRGCSNAAAWRYSSKIDGSVRFCPGSKARRGFTIPVISKLNGSLYFSTRRKRSQIFVYPKSNWNNIHEGGFWTNLR